VSTSPAFFTAVTRVDRTGLFDAAVATGAVAMPVKLPAPVLGTAPHAGPKSLIGETLDPDGIDEADEDFIGEDADDGAEAAELVELPELQAAAPSARPAAVTDTAKVR